MSDEPFRNPALTPEQRADDLLSRMTVEEKVAQLQTTNPKDRHAPNLDDSFPCGVGSISLLAGAWDETAADVAARAEGLQRHAMQKSRFGIPAFLHMETLTGPLMPGTTSFPVGLGRGATWDSQLERRVGQVASSEFRAAGMTHALGPVLDINRDARMGRVDESYGEDATLVSAMGTAYTAGIQEPSDLGDCPHEAIATAKHFIAYHTVEGGIHGSCSHVAGRELEGTFCRPFQAAIDQANLRSVMNQYGSVNGEPVVASKHLMRDLLRDRMGFDGVFISDYASVQETVTRQRVAADQDEAARRSLECGVDIEAPTPFAYGQNLVDLVRSGDVPESLLDQSVRRVLVEKFRIGLFEHPFPLGKGELSAHVRTETGHQASLAAARESLVLLKNDGVLPLDPTGMRIAVIGHAGASIRSLFGGYTHMSVLELAMGARNSMAGIEIRPESEGAWRDSPRPLYPGSSVEVEVPNLQKVASRFYPQTRTILDELRAQCPTAQVEYAYGFPYAGTDTSHFAEALELATNSDVAIVCVGGKCGWGTSCTTGEGIDSSSINLPPCQEQFLEQLGSMGVRFVVVHLDGRPISSDAADHYAAAIIEAWNPAECGSQAIVETLLGKNNPSGKLPVTIARSSAQLPLYYCHERGSSYHVGTDSPFRSYVDCPHEPRYPFGFGLSFTEFELGDLRLDQATVGPDQDVVAHLTVRNTGRVRGTTVVQAYVRDRVSSIVRPERELVGFCRVTLDPGQSAQVTFAINPTQFAFLDRDNDWKVEAGDFDLMFGTSSEDLPLQTAFRVQADGRPGYHGRTFFARTNVAYDIPSQEER
jgi:beta-glucosidase